MLIAEIAEYLNTKGIGVFDDGGIGGNIFLEFCPSSPDAVIYITASGGTAGDGKFPVDRSTVQMIVRDVEAINAEPVAQAIYDALAGFHHTRLVADTGTWIINCIALNPPSHMGTDELGRHEYSLNFQFEIINKNTAHRAW